VSLRKYSNFDSEEVFLKNFFVFHNNKRIFINLIFLQLVTPMNVIILNIVASDFLTCIFGSTVSLIASIHHGWYFGDAMCTINGYINAIMGEAHFSNFSKQKKINEKKTKN
jgi:hypothetical protein